MIVTAIYIEVESVQPDIAFTADTTLVTADDTYNTADETLISTGVANLQYQRIELFTDEIITLSSTIKNYNDLSKLFADFTKVFTIPASTHNNTIFKHWYESSVGETDLDNPVDLVSGTAFDHRKTYNGYIEIDTIPFKFGKFTMQKANIKDGLVDSYSINFTGSAIQLTDKFKDYKLNSLSGYDAYNVNYNEINIRNIITSTSYGNITRFPIIGSQREYEYLTGTANDVTTTAGAILWTDLFPSLKVSIILQLIQSNYGVTFTGAFLTSRRIQFAELYCKNAEQMVCKTELKKLQFSDLNGNLINVIRIQYQDTILYPAPPFPNVPVLRQTAVLKITTTSTNYNIFIYNNGVLYQSILNHSGNYFGMFFTKNGYFGEVNNFEFYVNSDVPLSFIFSPIVEKGFWFQSFVAPILQVIVQAYNGNPTIQSSQSTLRIQNYIPDITINDFLTGLMKMHNLMVIAKSETEFEFIELENWYNKGKLLDITDITTDSAIEINKPNLFKKIDFKYEKSENFVNNLYYTNLNQYYGDLFYENTQSSFTENYEVKLPFENVIWKKTPSEKWLTTTLVDKNLSPYTPKPMIIYNNGVETLTTPFQIAYTGGFLTASQYRRYSNEILIGGTDIGYLYSLNWGVETSPWYQSNATNGLYFTFYQNYIENLYNQRTRIVKVKAIMRPDEIASLKINDRIVLSNKRYLINNLDINLSTGEVDFELINDFRVLPQQYSGRYSNLPVLIIDNTAQEIEHLIYLNDYDSFDVKAPSGVATYSTSTGNETDILLNVTIPINTTGLDRTSFVNLEYFKDGVSTIVELPILQTL
jgi:hypothetical protein